jgi:hypothetical protein
MLHEMNSLAVDRSNRSRRKSGTAIRATCLLCRVLFPMIVQHRHLLFDAIRKQRRSFVRRCTPGDTQSAARLVFTTLREYQSMDHHRPEKSRLGECELPITRFPLFS